MCVILDEQCMFQYVEFSVGVTVRVSLKLHVVV